MADESKTADTSDAKSAAANPVEEFDLDLKDRGLAAFLAWLIPGAGHFYQGRHAKGILFLVCILGTFMYGMFLGGGRVVYAQWEPPKYRRYSYLCQLPVGLPSLPALLAANRDNRDPKSTFLFGTRWYIPPEPPDESMFRMGNEDQVTKASELHKVHYDYHRYFELGTVFTMIAGLLNILAIYDAWGGPAYAAKPDKEAGDEKK